MRSLATDGIERMRNWSSWLLLGGHVKSLFPKPYNVVMPTGTSNPFDFDETHDGHFEKLAKTNGIRFWLARDVMLSMGYESWPAFKTAINKAVGVCISTKIPVAEHFMQHRRKLMVAM